MGNKIKVDKLVNVRCELYQFTQFKSAIVTGQVNYVDFQTKQTIKAISNSKANLFLNINTQIMMEIKEP